MYDALRVSLTDVKCLPRKRDATTWAALLNLFGRDRPSFQSADIKLRLTRYLEVLGRTSGVRPHSNRLRPRNRGRCVAPDPFAIHHHECVVYPFKAPVVAQSGEPAVNRPPWRQVARQQPPRAARPSYVEDAVDDLVHRPLSWS